MKKRAVPMVAMIVFSMLVMMFPMGDVSAITGNYTPDEDHPYVGLVVFDVEDENGLVSPAWRGTGVLLSSTVVLTAGHCTDGAVAARIFLAQGPIPNIAQEGEYPYGGDESFEGIPITNPDFSYATKGNANGIPFFITNDVGIVILTEPVPEEVVDEYGVLPSEWYVEELAVGTGVDLVGYGVQYQVKPKNMGPYNAWTGLRQRFYAPAEILSGEFSWSDAFLRLTANAAQGKGGTSFGDSGGPVFEGGTNTILAVNSYVTNANSAGVTYSCRIDSPDILSWIETFLE